jgi:hypothetical protein
MIPYPFLPSYAPEHNAPVAPPLVQLLATMVLLQVVVAVLVDEFRRSNAQPPTSSRRLEQRTSLQPLLRDLTAAFESPDDLRARIGAAFDAVCATASSNPDPDDWDGELGAVKAVSLRGLQAGMAGLGYVPPIRFSRSEWHSMVAGPKLCNRQGRLGRHGFEVLIRDSLRSYQVIVLATFFRSPGIGGHAAGARRFVDNRNWAG